MKTLAFLTGGEMLAISWRSSRRQIITWVVLGMIAVFAATAASIKSFYGTAAELRSYAKAVSTDSSLDAISGRPYGLDNIGGPIAYECGFIAAIAIPLLGAAGSGSPTSTAPWATTSCSSSYNATGAPWARPWTTRTSPTPKPSPPSPSSSASPEDKPPLTIDRTPPPNDQSHI